MTVVSNPSPRAKVVATAVPEVSSSESGAPPAPFDVGAHAAKTTIEPSPMNHRRTFAKSSIGATLIGPRHQQKLSELVFRAAASATRDQRHGSQRQAHRARF